MIIVAADAADESAEVERVRELIRTRGGATEIWHDDGSALKEPLSQPEHFGFRDGISQPGLRGRASDDTTDLLTPRSTPDSPTRGKPGQELVWPGEFVFGYPDQDGSRHRGKADWMKDGAGFLRPRNGRGTAPIWCSADSSRTSTGSTSLCRKRVETAPQPRPGPGSSGAGLPVRRSTSAEWGRARFRQRQRIHLCGGSLSGNAHIRKVNPRDDLADVDQMRHRLLRRGIPFGVKSDSTPEAPVEDEDDRGLLFLAYMTSVEISSSS